MFKEMDKVVNEFMGYIETIIHKHECSSCESTEFEETFTLDEDYDFDVCDTCFRENNGR